MRDADPTPVVHLELHTGDLHAAAEFYAHLCGWRRELIETPHGDYTSLALGGAVGGGIVQCPTPRPLWLPYVEVPDIAATTERARRLGAEVLLEPREGPAGWRSVLTSPTAGELALWQFKR